MKHYKFTEISQFRNAIKEVAFLFKEKLPRLLMHGTVKVHGTNAGVVIYPDGLMNAQSKNHIITPEKDNCGFANWLIAKKTYFRSMHVRILDQFRQYEGLDMVIYGEWAGKGIQKGVATSQVDKFFYIFGVKIVTGSGEGEHIWLKGYPMLGNGKDILDSRSIWSRFMPIDFEQPALVQNELVSITNEIEASCPVGKYFGIHGVGEGVVWEYISDNGKKLTFKVKGEKHSSSKVKKLAEVDTEKVNSIDKFVTYAVTENRLWQAFNEACNDEPDRKFLGAFLKWINTDVNKEEGDTLADNGLTMKDVGGAISKRAKNWFFNKEML